jgi:hypothetical protein
LNPKLAGELEEFLKTGKEEDEYSPTSPKQMSQSGEGYLLDRHQFIYPVWRRERFTTHVANSEYHLVVLAARDLLRFPSGLLLLGLPRRPV